MTWIFSNYTLGKYFIPKCNQCHNLDKKAQHCETDLIWNIDSLNAALTSDSARAELSQTSSKHWLR